MGEIQSVKKNIILFGVPRSGTTWLSEILTHHNSISRIHEPDNELISFLGLLHKKGYPRFPYLRPEESHIQIDQLFEIVLNKDFYDTYSFSNTLCFKLYRQRIPSLQKQLRKHNTALKKDLFLSSWMDKLLVKGNRKERVLAKSVHGLLMIPYLMNRFKFIPIILQRHPLNVFSSYIVMNLPDRNRALFKQSKLFEDFNISYQGVEYEHEDFKAGFQLGVFRKVFKGYKKNLSEKKVVFVDYEKIIQSPYKEVAGICERLSIEYTSGMEQFMRSKFKSGKGFATNRVIDKQAEIWKERLETQQVDRFIRGYSAAIGEIDFKY